MRKYWSFFRIRLIHDLQYRTAAYAGIITQFAWGTMEILLYSAFYQANADSFPMTFPELASYVWLRQAFLALFNTWTLDETIFESIQTGGVAYELCRPIDLYQMWFLKTSATRIARTALRCLPILAVALFLPAPYRLTLPPDFLSFLLFLLSMLGGLATISGLCCLLYAVSFFTISPRGIRMILVTVGDFASGYLIPLPFLPKPLEQVLELLPFSATQAPLRIYSGNIGGTEAMMVIALQIFWSVVLIVSGRLLLAKAVKRAVIQGG